MVTIKETIIVPQDEPSLPDFEKNLTEENGWKRKETTTSVTYKRVRYTGIKGDTVWVS